MEHPNSAIRSVPSILGLAAIIIILAGIIFAQSFITPFLLALFISIICAQPVSWLEGKKIPRGVAILVVILGILAVFFGLGYLIGGSLASFSADSAQYGARLNEIAGSLIRFLGSKGLSISEDQLKGIIEPSRVLQFTAVALNQLAGVMGNAFMILFTVLFILLESSSFAIKGKAISRGGTEAFAYAAEITKNIRHYLGIKTVTSLLTSILIYIALLIIGVDYAILWALIAFLLNYIPTIGSIIALLPALLFSLVQFGWGGALWTLIVYLVINNAVAIGIEPRMMGKGMGLSTLVVFISLVFWGFVLGTVGMFLSVPLTMSMKIMFEQREETRWIAILLGTPAEAEAIVEERSEKEGKEKNL
jgi:AI-2 transport protein TqsA